MPFLETIEKGITKARDFGELSRLNGEIAIRENHRKECFTVLGEKYYHSLKDGQKPDCTILYQELEAMDRELEQLLLQVGRGDREAFARCKFYFRPEYYKIDYTIA